MDEYLKQYLIVYWKRKSLGFPKGLGFRDIAKKLQAQEDKDFKVGIQCWIDILNPQNAKVDAKTIDQAVSDYPKILSFVNAEEFFYLLQKFPVMDEGYFFSAIKKENDSVLLSILKNNVFTKDDISGHFAQFISKDKEGVFISFLMHLVNSTEMSWTQLHVLLDAKRRLLRLNPIS